MHSHTHIYIYLFSFYRVAQFNEDLMSANEHVMFNTVDEIPMPVRDLPARCVSSNMVSRSRYNRLEHTELGPKA